MKKAISLCLLFIGACFCFTSCDDDDDLPNVDFVVNFENATEVDGYIYVVRGQEFEIQSITCINNDGNKAVELGYASFYWDYVLIGASTYRPYAFEITVSEETGLGRHVLEIACPVYAVDKSPANAVIRYNMMVVESEDDIPSGGNSSVSATPVIGELDD